MKKFILFGLILVAIAQPSMGFPEECENNDEETAFTTTSSIAIGIRKSVPWRRKKPGGLTLRLTDLPSNATIAPSLTTGQKSEIIINSDA